MEDLKELTELAKEIRRQNAQLSNYESHQLAIELMKLDAIKRIANSTLNFDSENNVFAGILNELAHLRNVIEYHA